MTGNTSLTGLAVTASRAVVHAGRSEWPSDYSPAVVRTTFAAVGIPLRHTSAPDVSPRWLSATPLPVPTTGLYVMVGARSGRVDWEPKPSGVDHPLGNLLVHYGGSNATTLTEVKAAVRALRGR